MPNKKLPPTKKIAELYQSGLSYKDIGDMYGATKETVFYHLKKMGISRTQSETWNLPGRHKPLQTKEWFYQKYWIEDLSMVDIGLILGRDPKTILFWFRKHGIDRRPRGYNRDDNLQNGRMPGFTNSEETKEKIGKASRERGAVPYLRNGKHWMDGIKPEDNPNWKGGVTPERTALYNSQEWKQAIKEVWKRDNAICQRCGLDAREVYWKDRKFHTHHIVPFADSIELRAEPNNLVLLCNDCHHWVHSNDNVNKEFLREIESI